MMMQTSVALKKLKFGTFILPGAPGHEQVSAGCSFRVWYSSAGVDI